MLSLNPYQVVHVGDSLVSDVLGAQNMGIKVIWINRNKKARKKDIFPDKECSNFLQLLKESFL